jgi:hypothetical protein
MLSVTNFLQKFLNLEKDNATKLSIIIDVIKQTSGLGLSKDMLEIKGDNLKVNCNPVFRNEIFMHQTQIEDSLKSQKIFLKIV